MIKTISSFFSPSCIRSAAERENAARGACARSGVRHACQAREGSQLGSATLDRADLDDCAFSVHGSRRAGGSKEQPALLPARPRACRLHLAAEQALAAQRWVRGNLEAKRGEKLLVLVAKRRQLCRASAGETNRGETKGRAHSQPAQAVDPPPPSGSCGRGTWRELAPDAARRPGRRDAGANAAVSGRSPRRRPDVLETMFCRG